MLACRYLTTSVKTHYTHFIQLREEHIKSGKQLNLNDYKQNDGVECALWPNLYLFYEWCEAKLSGNTSRQSAKFSFTMKILSEILDYALDYDLLQFVYDRWLFTTVSGAIYFFLTSPFTLHLQYLTKDITGRVSATAEANYSGPEYKHY